MKKILFIDRDGTLIDEPPITRQVSSVEQFKLLPGLIRNLKKLSQAGFELVMVSNQDGLGTDANPQPIFDRYQNLLLDILASEDIYFHGIHVDGHYEAENHPDRKPGTGMLLPYFNGQYDLAASWVIGDRLTDAELAQNMGAKALLIQGTHPLSQPDNGWVCRDWDEVSSILLDRKAQVFRQTRETRIAVEINPDGSGYSEIQTGLPFLDHMLDQISRHGSMDIKIVVDGDWEIDEHHSTEDLALCLGEAMRKALGNKAGIERYGFVLPMDDALAEVALDFGGRPYLNWNLELHREKVGNFPTELLPHFFRSWCDAAGANLYIKSVGENSHHQIEAVFKAFARSLKQAFRRSESMELPSTKGVL